MKKFLSVILAITLLISCCFIARECAKDALARRFMLRVQTILYGYQNLKVTGGRDSISVSFSENGVAHIMRGAISGKVTDTHKTKELEKTFTELYDAMIDAKSKFLLYDVPLNLYLVNDESPSFVLLAIEDGVKTISPFK